MSIDFLKELEVLEHKIGSLAQTLEELKGENAALREAASGADGLQGRIEALNGEVAALKDENAGLKSDNADLLTQLDGLRANANGHRKNMDAAAERIKGLLARLDAAR